MLNINYSNIVTKCLTTQNILFLQLINPQHFLSPMFFTPNIFQPPTLFLTSHFADTPDFFYWWGPTHFIFVVMEEIIPFEGVGMTDLGRS